MVLTRDSKQTTYARAQRNSAFRKALLTEAVNAYLRGEQTVGKVVLKDFINATIGFERLATLARIPRKSLHRMLSATGSPSTAGFFAILRALQERFHLQLKVGAARGYENREKIDAEIRRDLGEIDELRAQSESSELRSKLQSIRKTR